MFRKVSGLTLKPRKCVLVLTSITPSAPNIKRIREWLSVYVPEWIDFLISDHAKYLGVYLGPKAGCMQWKGPIAKYQKRVDDIWSSHLSASAASREYNIKTVSILGYVAQFVPPPPNFRALETASIGKCLHLATSSLTQNSCFQLQLFINTYFRSAFF